MGRPTTHNFAYVEKAPKVEQEMGGGKNKTPKTGKEKGGEIQLCGDETRSFSK